MAPEHPGPGVTWGQSPSGAECSGGRNPTGLDPYGPDFPLGAQGFAPEGFRGWNPLALELRGPEAAWGQSSVEPEIPGPGVFRPWNLSGPKHYGRREPTGQGGWHREFIPAQESGQA